MIGVFFALHFEAKDYKRISNSSDTGVFIIGKTGFHITDGLDKIIRKNNIQCIVLIGLAGGLKQSLSIGDVVVAKNYTSQRFFSCLDIPNRSFGFAHLATVDRVLESRADKAIHGSLAGADCCDMETSHVWDLAQNLSLPMITIRAISDTWDTDLPVPGNILIDTRTGQPGAFKILRHLLTHPKCIPGFVRMLKQASCATRQLANVADREIIPCVRKSLGVSLIK